MIFALIEDNKRLGHLITLTLRMYDHTVMYFSDCASFVASLPGTSYDFILVDYNVPGSISGLQVITLLQENRPTVPLLVISGASESLLKSLRTLYPHLPLLCKPFSTQTLLQSIEMHRRPPKAFSPND